MSTRGILSERISELIEELRIKLDEAEMLDNDFSISRELCEQLNEEIDSIE